MDGILERLIGREVWTGSGQMLGRVVSVDWPRLQGALPALVVRQTDGDKDWIVDMDQVKRVGARIELKGPREGFHIAPLPPAT